MRFVLFMLLHLVVAAGRAQDVVVPSIDVGDAAPPLRIREWIKGSPVTGFEPGKVYVIEFWASWCRPCIASMPHLSELARHYKDSVTFIAIEVYEMKGYSAPRVRRFVDSMGRRMDFAVAKADSNFMEAQWFDSAGERGIPRTFVINDKGKLAWTGHPSLLAPVLSDIVHGDWRVEDELAKRRRNRYLAMLDDSLQYEFVRFAASGGKPARPDSALLFVASVVRDEPGLKYADHMAFHTLTAFLETDQRAACEYGDSVLVTSGYDGVNYSTVYNAIGQLSDKVSLSTEVWLLGARAYELDIASLPYPELFNVPKMYHGLANCYWQGKQPDQAIVAEEKAIETLRNRNEATGKDMAAYKLRLREYRNGTASRSFRRSR